MMKIDFFVWEWFHENKLNKTRFEFLPLEILTKIWKLKRKYEILPIKSFLKIHLIYQLRGSGRRSLWKNQKCVHYPYVNENKIHIQKNLKVNVMGIMLKEVCFSKYVERTTRSIGGFGDFCVPVTRPDEEDGIHLSAALRKRVTLFSFSIAEGDDFNKKIAFENFTKESKKKRYNVFHLKK